MSPARCPPEELKKTAAEAAGIYGSIDVLVNNAGNTHFGMLEDATPDDWQAQFGSNFFGPIYTTQAFLPYMRKQKSGTIVFISSLAGFQGFSTLSLYCSSKHAMTGAAASFAGEVSGLGIRTITINPGFFRTSLLTTGNTRYIDTQFDDYKPMLKQAYEQFEGIDGTQVGDPVKGAARIVDVVRGEGLAEGKEFPASLYLGPDCYAAAVKQAEDNLALLKEWKELSKSTDYS
ncbi:hypothetical protein LTR66_010690 [Elasticomyces elasticus]|nr:hypothetical protein LTR66_010690 [Elasticomyces elasticus]